MANPSAVSEVYKVIRTQVEHVDNNLSQRVVWLVIAQSFFFSGYSILITGKASLPQSELTYEALIKILPVAALLTVIFTSVDVITSLVYMRSLRRKYENSLRSDIDLDNAYPSITGSKSQRVFMHVSPILIPALFIIIWIVLLVIQYAYPSAPPPALAH